MGSGSSRMRSPRHRADGRPKLGLASFLCGGASSSSSSSAASSSQVENEPSEIPMVAPRIHHQPSANNLQGSVKDSSLSLTPENSASSSTDEHLISRITSNGSLKSQSPDLSSETNEFVKCFSESRELVPCLPNTDSDVNITHSGKTSDLGSTSTKPEHVEPVFANENSIPPPVNLADNTTNISRLLTSPLRFSSDRSDAELPANEILSTENFSNELLGVHNSDPATVSDSSGPWHLSREVSSFEENLPTSTFLSSSESGEPRNGTLLHLDVVSISSNASPIDTVDTSDHEARGNNRRLFWDAFSRRSSLRNNDYTAILLTTEDSDDIGFRGTSLLGFGDGSFEDDSMYMRRRRHGLSGLSWPSRSEIRDRFHGSYDDNGGQTSFCPSGLHPDGTCSCDSLMIAGESSTRASISRIVMLAEALFEVLDEIHRQPVSLSLSMASLPAAESVVNSLPLKHYSKLNFVSGDDPEQCYICLAEYDEGDDIRVLPCNHEYHMSCVDKWLKEIHGVCPLCRGDVRGATNANEGPTLNL